MMTKTATLLVVIIVVIIMHRINNSLDLYQLDDSLTSTMVLKQMTMTMQVHPRAIVVVPTMDNSNSNSSICQLIKLERENSILPQGPKSRRRRPPPPHRPTT
jgi:hypothetical protein